MSWLRVNRCICGCNVKTGSLILLWLSVVCGGLQLTSELSGMFDGPHFRSEIGAWYHSYQFFNSLAILVCSVAGVYAIEKKKPSLLLPYIWYNVISLITAILLIFTLPIFWSAAVTSKAFDDALNDAIKQNEENMSEADKEQLKTSIKDVLFNVVLPTTEIILIICTAIGIHFTSVVYSCYKTMLEEFRSPILYDAAVIEGKPGYPSLPAQDVIVPSYPIYPPPYTAQPNEPGMTYKTDNESKKYPPM